MTVARHTASIVITKNVLYELVAYCSEPDILRDILQRSARLVLTPTHERERAVEDLERFCQDAPCLLWQPAHKPRHVEVPLRNLHNATAIVSVTRVIWTAYHVIPEQGDNRGIGMREEILHTCGRNGNASTGYDACLNPAHMVRANVALRHELARTRRIMREHHVSEVRV